ncbi:MAG: glycoside hydrolase family 3 C-terminal domain-containing protein [Lachnospiraceae bacterium]|nr:glycoside hydrolase family 3 C-terminal domain-containing protein [Lachnospiraceae bacterium]
MGNNNSLTLDERIRLLTGVGAWHTFDANGKLPEIMMTDGPHGLRKVSNEAVENNNGSHVATCFPTLSAMAASWNPEAVSKMAKGIANEAVSEHVAVVLGPGINMKRSPLCGRNFEYFSEDPYLAGTLGTAYVKAVQEAGIGTCLKHFACNSQETRRFTSNSLVDERALREIYLKAFEMVIKNAQPTSIMPSYNLVNGLHSTENKKLLTDILRDEWGFLGVTISDWGAATDLADDVLAGLNLEMPDSAGLHAKDVYKALEEGRITEEDIIRSTDKMVAFVTERAASLKKAEEAAGLPDIKDAAYETRKKAHREKLLKDNHELACSLAAECAVLLKNDGILPINKDEEKVVIIGDMADKMRYQGGGSSHINASDVPSLISELEKKGYKVTFIQGYSSESNTRNPLMEKEALEKLDEVLTLTPGAPVIYACGLTDYDEGEGYDRTHINVCEGQISLYNKLKMLTKNIVAVTFSGSPMDISFLADARAILHMYLCGQGVGRAAADLLSGDKNPSGKLAETFPAKLNETPAYSYYGLENTDDVYYAESLFTGYRFYNTFGIKVLYPFGYGLSYTSFEYKDLQVKDPHHISFKLKNTGKTAGAEICQVYTENPSSGTYREKKKLTGFKKVFLNAGEEKDVEIELSEDAYTIYDRQAGKFITVSGNYKILVSASVEDDRLSAEVEIKGERPSKEESLTYPFTKEQFEKIYDRPIISIDKRTGGFTRFDSLSTLKHHTFLAKVMLMIGRRVIRKSLKGKRKDDPEVLMMAKGLEENTLDALTYMGGIPTKFADRIVKSANKKQRKKA